MRAAKAERAGGIQHPLAKYNNVGKLTCKLCQVIVPSDAQWPAHLLSSTHSQASYGVGLVARASLSPAFCRKWMH